ncbi:TROVE domain-containing protein [Candidatus Dojkabacteria bacterium]|jgi:hypothetical protein|nr:TROVE domain-containing protein [Candidatus Dojkabacteria bacterium]
MASINKVPKEYTHEGVKASHISPEKQLRRTVMACMLWENTFYEDGKDVADRIVELVPKINPLTVSDIAVEARTEMKLRHVPLLIARAMLKSPSHKVIVRDLLPKIILRPDELTEFLAIYWKDGKCPIAAQAKKGLAEAFTKFDAYSLAKYNRDGVIKLRDVLFMCHAKPKDKEQELLWKKLIDKTLPIPDTWEVALSGGANKKSTWERLLKENKLGALALLRNLRNMSEVKVEEKTIFQALENMNAERVLPFRFIAAAKYVPNWESVIGTAMLKCIKNHEKLPGKTALLIDGSGSMKWAISEKSDLTRFEAACALAILAREICESCNVVVFSNNAFNVPDRRGFALRDAIHNKAQFGATHIQDGIDLATKAGYDRIIIFTDEQSAQSIHNPIKNSLGYVINVASYKNGIGYGEWLHIDGFSEAVVNFIIEMEKGDKL